KLQTEIATSAPRTEPASQMAAAAAAATPPPGPASSLSYKPAVRAADMVVPATPAKNGRFPVVVIAASTGGPATLIRCLPSFPANFPGAVIVVQHMPGTFTSQFAQQLAEVCPIRVKEAEPGEIIAPSQMYLCPGSHHLRISATGRITLDDGPRISGYRPCA